MPRKNHIVTISAILLFAVTGYAQDTSIRPFRASVPDEALSDLRRRIAATRWPEKETVNDATAGRATAKKRRWSGPGHYPAYDHV